MAQVNQVGSFQVKSSRLAVSRCACIDSNDASAHMTCTLPGILHKQWRLDSYVCSILTV